MRVPRVMLRVAIWNHHAGGWAVGFSPQIQARIIRPTVVRIVRIPWTRFPIDDKAKSTGEILKQNEGDPIAPAAKTTAHAVVSSVNGPWTSGGVIIYPLGRVRSPPSLPQPPPVEGQ